MKASAGLVQKNIEEQGQGNSFKPVFQEQDSFLVSQSQFNPKSIAEPSQQPKAQTPAIRRRSYVRQLACLKPYVFREKGNFKNDKEIRQNYLLLLFGEHPVEGSPIDPSSQNWIKVLTEKMIKDGGEKSLGLLSDTLTWLSNIAGMRHNFTQEELEKYLKRIGSSGTTIRIQDTMRVDLNRKLGFDLSLLSLPVRKEQIQQLAQSFKSQQDMTVQEKSQQSNHGSKRQRDLQSDFESDGKRSKYENTQNLQQMIELQLQQINQQGKIHNINYQNLQQFNNMVTSSSGLDLYQEEEFNDKGDYTVHKTQQLESIQKHQHHSNEGVQSINASNYINMMSKLFTDQNSKDLLLKYLNEQQSLQHKQKSNDQYRENQASTFQNPSVHQQQTTSMDTQNLHQTSQKLNLADMFNQCNNNRQIMPSANTLRGAQIFQDVVQQGQLNQFLNLKSQNPQDKNQKSSQPQQANQDSSQHLKLLNSQPNNIMQQYLEQLQKSMQNASQNERFQINAITNILQNTQSRQESSGHKSNQAFRSTNLQQRQPLDKQVLESYNLESNSSKTELTQVGQLDNSNSKAPQNQEQVLEILRDYIQIQTQQKVSQESAKQLLNSTLQFMNQKQQDKKEIQTTNGFVGTSAFKNIQEPSSNNFTDIQNQLDVLSKIMKQNNNTQGKDLNPFDVPGNQNLEQIFQNLKQTIPQQSQQVGQGNQVSNLMDIMEQSHKSNSSKRSDQQVKGVISSNQNLSNLFYHPLDGLKGDIQKKSSNINSIRFDTNQISDSLKNLGSIIKLDEQSQPIQNLQKRTQSISQPSNSSQAFKNDASIKSGSQYMYPGSQEKLSNAQNMNNLNTDQKQTIDIPSPIYDSFTTNIHFKILQNKNNQQFEQVLLNNSNQNVQNITVGDLLKSINDQLLNK